MSRPAAAIAACTLALPALSVAPAHAATTASPQTVSAGTYLVLLRAQPLATYDGHIDGLAATAPRAGERFRGHSPAARAYGEQLASGQARLIAALGSPDILYSYTTAVDGFAAVLTSDQVKLAQSAPGVLSVETSQTARLDSVGSGRPLQETASLGQTPARHDGAPVGHRVVVGVIDSGIWPENPSFAGVPTDRATLTRTYPGFSGSCATGERWRQSICNAKVIAAQYFVKGFGRDNVAVADFMSPRDGSGHGSHTAALAAGNAGVDVTIGGQDFGRISGVAPAAALSIYKACWTSPDPLADGCATADTVEAIDRAVSDGVDVISYSIGDAGRSVRTDAVALAFFNAAQAGVFIATSGGDGGPGPSTVSHGSPWVTTVAATTDQQRFRGTVTLGDGSRYPGSMVADRGVGPARLVDAADARAPGASAHDAALCYPGALDASAVDKAIVLCRRGDTARVSKSSSVERSGGIAMVLANVAPGGTDDDIHSVPTVQVSERDGEAITAYIARANAPTASLDPAAPRTDQPPRLAGFSSRGPDALSGGDVLKPDVAAPGVGVVSAVAPPSNFGRLWDLASGTSMAAPQVAGLAADILAAHPTWSPAAIKSALMTTATPLRAGTGPPAGGAGEIDVHRALDPGLVYDVTGAHWLNLASVSVGDLVAARTVERRVTNVSDHAETYTAQVQGLPGVGVSVAPSTLVLGPGQTRSFSLTFLARRGARYEQFVSGSLTWAGSRRHRVTSPLAVRPSYVAAPAEVRSSGRRGTATVTARAGVTGTLTTTMVGLVGTRPVHLSLSPSVFAPAHPEQTPAAWSRTYDVPTNTAAARFAVSSHGGGDVDIYVYRDDKLVASSVSASSAEQVTLPDPAAGRYVVYVNAPAPRSAQPTSADFTGWVLPRAVHDAHVSAERRRNVTGGRPFRVAVSWSDLSTSRRWFGELSYQHSSAVTYITLD